MCLEDLKLGSNRYAQLNTVAGLGALVIKPNNRRVAVLISMMSHDPTAYAFIYASPNATTLLPIAQVNYDNANLTLTLEQYGTLVTGPLAILGVLTDFLSITEILLDVDLGRPINR